MTLRQQFEKERGNGITGFTFGYTQHEYIKWLESRLSNQTTPEPMLCEAGCKRFTGGEVHHHKDCVYYPDSMSRRYDEMEAELSPEVMANVTDKEHVTYCHRLSKERLTEIICGHAGGTWMNETRSRLMADELDVESLADRLMQLFHDQQRGEVTDAVDWKKEYDAAVNEIGQLQDQLKDAESEIRQLNNELREH